MAAAAAVSAVSPERYLTYFSTRFLFLSASVFHCFDGTPLRDICWFLSFPTPRRRGIWPIYIKKKSRIEWNSRGLLATNARVLIAHFHCPPRQALAWMLRRRPSRFYAGPTSLLMDRSGKRGQNGQLRRHHSRSRIVREKEERRIFCAWNSRPLVEMPLLLSYHLFSFFVPPLLEELIPLTSPVVCVCVCARTSQQNRAADIRESRERVRALAFAPYRPFPSRAPGSSLVFIDCWSWSRCPGVGGAKIESPYETRWNMS